MKNTRHEALVNLYNSLSNDDLMDIITMAGPRFFIWDPHSKTCYELDDDPPCCMNGSQIQINIHENI